MILKKLWLQNKSPSGINSTFYLNTICVANEAEDIFFYKEKEKKKDSFRLLGNLKNSLKWALSKCSLLTRNRKCNYV